MEDNVKEICMFGELHELDHDTTTMLKTIEDALKSKPSVDVYVEASFNYQQKQKGGAVLSNKGFFDDLEELKTQYPNLRVHYSDIRFCISCESDYKPGIRGRRSNYDPFKKTRSFRQSTISNYILKKNTGNTGINA